VLQHYDEVRRLGAEVVAVTQARPEVLAAALASVLAPILDSLSFPFPIVGDPDRVAYKAFGLERAGLTTMMRPGVILGYLRAIFRGWMPRKPLRGEDVLQLGGDFVLDREGRLVYAHRSATPTDRPSAQELIDVIMGGTEDGNAKCKTENTK
jgi:peroxiredoxin